MKTKKFYDIDHARMYLNDSIIRVESEPIYVLGIYSENYRRKLKYYTLKDMINDGGKEKYIPLVSPKLNYNPVPLGYSNTKGGCYYISRIAGRQWKMGLHIGNINITDIYGARLSKSMSRFLSDGSLRNTIINNYPSYRETLENIKSKSIHQAFHRRYAITSESQLYHALIEEPIGFCSPTGPVLTPPYECMRNIVMEVIEQCY